MTVYLHINCKLHAACDLNFIVKGEVLLKVTGSHVHWKTCHLRIDAIYRCNSRPLRGSDTFIWHIL